MVKLSTKIPVFVFFMLIALQATAGRVEGLYNVEIAVAAESKASREQAFIAGLDKVFVRISGDSIVMDKLKRPSASRYVKQFSYEPIAEPEPQQDGILLTQYLKIQYNGSAMEKYLLDNGFAAWGEHRPDLVVWLVVRDGKNEYVLKNNHRSLLKKVAVESLDDRGIPNRWPKFDSQDKKILSVSDIRGGFKEPVIKASQRYSRGPALSGSLIWNGRRWTSSWSLLMEGGNRHWALDDKDYNSLISKAMDQAADALGAVFAVHTVTDKSQLATVSLDVLAVDNIDSYHFLESYLLGLSAVESVKPSLVDGKKAVIDVLLRSNEDDFLNLIKNDGQLTELSAPEIPLPSIAQITTAQKQSGDSSSTAGKAPPLLLPEGPSSENASVNSAASNAPETTETAGVEQGNGTLLAARASQTSTYYYRLNPPQ